MKSYNIENSFLKTTILPKLGGRIDSLIFKPNDKEWVWKDSAKQNNSVSKYSNYDENWQGGWEELFPNDAIEDFGWGKGLDHGELWSADWNVEYHDSSKLHLKTKSLDSGTTFEKIVEIYDNKLRCEYFGDIKFAEYFLFKLHLAIPIEEKIDVICDYESLNKVESNFGNIINNNQDFFTLTKNSGLYDFGYVNMNKKNLNVKDSTNNSLKLSYGNTNLDYFWIFQTQGGWRNHNVLVLEPASNSKKNLKDAIAENKSLKGPMSFKCFYEVELT